MCPRAAAATFRWPTKTWVGYATGVWTHVGDRFTQVGDEDLGSNAAVSLTTFTGTIGGPLTQNHVHVRSEVAGV